MREAEESGDLYALRGLCSWRGNISWLLQDQPETARRTLAAVTTPRQPGDPFHLHHYYELLSRTQVDLYTGAIGAASERLDVEWRHLERSLLLRIQSVRIEGQHLRGRVAIARALAELAVIQGQLARTWESVPPRGPNRPAAIAVDVRRTQERLQARPTGDLSVPLPAASGEGLGPAVGMTGNVWHWLRLDHGQIASVFMCDPAWSWWPLLESALVGVPVEDLPVVMAQFGLSVSAVDL